MRSVVKFAVTIAFSGVVGYFAGNTGAISHVEAAARPGTLRASRFELVNSGGASVATWSVQGNEAHLRFLSGRGGDVPVDIGVLSDGRPFVSMAGRDGKRRIVLELDQHDKPILGMSDERWEGRLVLGFVEPDTYTPEWDNWGLMFNPVGSEQAAASIGVLNMNGSGPEGVLTLSGRRVR
jgi:hypothetical protein